MAERSKSADHRRHVPYPLTDFLEAGSAGPLNELLERLVARQVTKRVRIETTIGRGGVDTAPSNPVTVPRPGRSPGKGLDGPPILDLLHELFDGVSLCRFHGSAIESAIEQLHGSAKKQGPQRYAYDIGLNTDKIVGFVVPNPFDTVITFGHDRADEPRPTNGVGLPPLDRSRTTSRVYPLTEDRAQRAPREPGSVLSDRTGKVTPAVTRAGKLPAKGGRKRPDRRPGLTPPEPTRPAPQPPPLCDLNVRLMLLENGLLEMIQLSGRDVRIHFSRGLVRPVRKTRQGTFVPTGERLSVRLGDETITLRRGKTPRLSAPLVFDDNLVQVGGQGVIAILKQVTLGGTSAKPKLIFDQTELIL
jgi:hypothetical protein